METVTQLRGHGDDHLGGGAVVRVVVNGNVVAGLFGLALSPNLLGLRGVALVGQNEVNALLGSALVANGHFMLFAGFGDAIEVHVQLGVVGRKARILAIEAGAQDRQPDGIEIERAQAIFERGQGMGDLADDLALIQIKAQFDADILEVVIAAGGKRLVCASGGDDHARAASEHERNGRDASPRLWPRKRKGPDIHSCGHLLVS